MPRSSSLAVIIPAYLFMRPRDCSTSPLSDVLSLCTQLSTRGCVLHGWVKASRVVAEPTGLAVVESRTAVESGRTATGDIAGDVAADVCRGESPAITEIVE